MLMSIQRLDGTFKACRWFYIYAHTRTHFTMKSFSTRARDIHKLPLLLLYVSCVMVTERGINTRFAYPTNHFGVGPPVFAVEAAGLPFCKRSSPVEAGSAENLASKRADWHLVRAR
jgi:hypothetical protein